MKLATYKDGSRDGQLVVVSRDLTQAHYATHIANRMQQVLDDWNFLSPLLQDVYDSLNAGRARHAFPFDPAQCLAPLPRAYQWVSGGAYPHHAELLRRASEGGGASEAVRAATALTEPQMAHGPSDDLLGPCAPVVVASASWGVDFGAGLAAVTGDVPMGSAADRALDSVRLLLLVNQTSLQGVSAPMAAALGPVAVTPDELGDAWSRGRVHLPLQCTWNGRKVGMCEAGEDMTYHFGKLIAHACRTRPVRAGSIVSTGPVSNRGIERKGRTDWPQGYTCIAQKRAMEQLQDGKVLTGFMRLGDTIRIEVKGRDGHSVFGAITQELVPLGDGL